MITMMEMMMTIEMMMTRMVGMTTTMKIKMTSHALMYKCTSFVFEGDNLNRYLLGRQFMVILIVFVVELSGAFHPSKDDDDLWGLPSWLLIVFLSSGLAMIMFTCMVGQLNSEIIGCHYMLDYRKYSLMFMCFFCNRLVCIVLNTDYMFPLLSTCLCCI